MALSDSGVETQIQHMIAFIEQEAKEKVEEIQIKAEEEFNIEKGRLIHEQRHKLIDLFERKSRQHTLKKKIIHSNIVNQSKLEILKAKESALKNCIEKTGGKLVTMLIDERENYKSLLEKLILQCLCTLTETKVIITCFERDSDFIKSKISYFKESFLKLTDINVDISIDNKYLSERSIGGIIVTSSNGLIKTDNTLEKILNQTFKSSQSVMDSIVDITTRKWDPNQVYDISREERSLRLKRAQLRIENSKVFIKATKNPYINIGNLNPAMHRYSSMEVHTHLFYRASPKSHFYQVLFVLPPLVLFAAVWTAKTKFEKRISTGQIKYSERNFKYVV